jgi:hypothetical protein
MEDVSRVLEELRSTTTIALENHEPEDLEAAAARLSAFAVRLRHEAYQLRRAGEGED